MNQIECNVIKDEQGMLTPAFPQGVNGVVHAHPEVLVTMVEQLNAYRQVIMKAAEELEAEHYKADDVPGCVICWPADGHWPCVSKMITDDLRQALEDGR